MEIFCVFLLINVTFKWIQGVEYDLLLCQKYFENSIDFVIDKPKAKQIIMWLFHEFLTKSYKI